MVSYENLESLREATIEDVGGILKLIEPLEADGTLVKRGRELIEREIHYFSVIEHDGVIFGCAALYPFNSEKMAEMACLTVNPEVQTQGDGERLLQAHGKTRAQGRLHQAVRADHPHRTLVPETRLYPGHRRRPAKRSATHV